VGGGVVVWVGGWGGGGGVDAATLWPRYAPARRPDELYLFLEHTYMYKYMYSVDGWCGDVGMPGVIGGLYSG